MKIEVSNQPKMKCTFFIKTAHSMKMTFTFDAISPKGLTIHELESFMMIYESIQENLSNELKTLCQSDKVFFIYEPKDKFYEKITKFSQG